MSSPASENEALNILFTSAGRRVELLRAFREAAAELALEVRLLVTEIDPLAPSIQVADGFYRVPRVSDPAYPGTLVKICEQENVQLVFPLLDHDIPVLAANRDLIEQTGCRVVVVDHQAAELTRDKWRTYTFLRELEVPTPRSWLPVDPDGEVGPFPLFIKPRHGSAGKNSFLARNEAQLEFFSEYVREPIIQQYLEGPEITNDVSCGLNGEVLAVVSRRRIEVRWGEVAKGVTVDEPGIRQECIRIARGLKAIGPITIQCMHHQGQHYFTEINARFGGGLPLGIAAGVHSPKWYLAQAAGIPMELPPIGEYQKGLYLTRYDESFFLEESEIDRFARDRI